MLELSNINFIKRKKFSILGLILLGLIAYLNYIPSYYPPSFTIQNFPLLKQPDNITCGPTSTAMLLNYYGCNATIDEVKKKTKTQWISYKGESIGMTAPDLVLYALNHFNIPSKIYRTSVDKIKYFVSQNRPPILLVRSGLKTWHYVVVVGYDQQDFLLADPAIGNIRKISLKDLEDAWSFKGDLRGVKFEENDYWRHALEVVEIQGQTLIVPKKRS